MTSCSPLPSWVHLPTLLHAEEKKRKHEVYAFVIQASQNVSNTRGGVHVQSKMTVGRVR